MIEEGGEEEEEEGGREEEEVRELSGWSFGSDCWIEGRVAQSMFTV